MVKYLAVGNEMGNDLLLSIFYRSSLEVVRQKREKQPNLSTGAIG
jgi:hypothetical protein